MTYGNELIAQLEREIKGLQECIDRRAERINNCETDMDDCFISQRCEERGIQTAKEKIALLKNGGCDWFVEYATLDGRLVKAKWCECRSFTGFGTETRLRIEMPDGAVKWTSALTKKGLEKHGIKRVLCLRPAWFAFKSSDKGMLGVYTGQYVTFPSDINYATGEAAAADPIEAKDWEETKV